MVAVSTVFYAALTWRLVVETRLNEEVQTEPRVSVRVEASRDGNHGYELVIRNEGLGPAKNVHFEFEGDPSYFRSSWMGRSTPPTIDQLPVIKDGLDYLEPDQKFIFPLGSTSEEEFSRATQAPWIFHVKYQSLFGKCKLDYLYCGFLSIPRHVLRAKANEGNIRTFGLHSKRFTPIH